MSRWRWREGWHWQVDASHGSAWVGITTDRMMVGVVLHWESRQVGVGVGPIYFGCCPYNR